MAKKALLIGINRHRTVHGADLRGCINDVMDVTQVLLDFYGFAENDITVLRDFDATQARIKAGIQTLISNSTAGDVLLLHYSGHGSNVPDKNGDEADFRDEILCPTDLDWYDPLLDDWLGQQYDSLPEGVNLSIIMDCCHSGTINRAFLPPDSRENIERYLACPLDLLAAESDRGLRGDVRNPRSGGQQGIPAPAAPQSGVPEVMISGCQDDQTSADAYIDGAFHGAMTYHLVSAIREAGGRISYGDLHARTVEGLSDGGFSQSPQFRGEETYLAEEFLSPFA
jgi:uncharacterized caspase-like protein